MVTIISVLAGFTAFDLLWVMGAGYPGQRTLSLVVFMYFEAFQKGGWAFGGAIAVVIGVLVLLVTWLQAAAPGSRRTDGALMAVALDALRLRCHRQRRERGAAERAAGSSFSSPP